MSAGLRHVYYALKRSMPDMRTPESEVAREVYHSWSQEVLDPHRELARMAILHIASDEGAFPWALREAPYWWSDKIKSDTIINEEWLRERVAAYAARGVTCDVTPR